MRPCSDAYLRAVREGGRRVQRAYAINNGVAVEVPGLVDFNITASRSQIARSSGTVTFSPDVDQDLLSPYGARVQVRDGFLINGSEELVAVHTGRVQDLSNGDEGKVVASVFSLEKAVQDAGLVAPVVIDSGSAVTEISALLSIVRNAGVSVLTSRDARVPRVVYERDRWKAIDGDDSSMARALGVEVYCDADGTFIIRDIPTLDDDPVWTVDAGPQGVLVGYAKKSSRDGVYSRVVAESDRVSENGVRGGAVDDDPRSATYVGGDFGEVTRFYSSPLLTTDDQANTAAESLLADSKGLARSLSFATVPNPAIEPGDLVTVVFPDGSEQAHLIDSLTYTVAGTQAAQTRTTA